MKCLIAQNSKHGKKKHVGMLVAHGTEIFDNLKTANVQLYIAPHPEHKRSSKMFIGLEGTPTELRKLCRSILRDLRKPGTV